MVKKAKKTNKKAKKTKNHVKLHLNLRGPKGRKKLAGLAQASPYGTGIIMTEEGFGNCVGALMRHRGYQRNEELASKICKSVRTKFANKWPMHERVREYRKKQAGSGYRSSVTVKLHKLRH